MGFPSRDNERGAIRIAIVGNDPFGRRDLADRLERSADLEVVEIIDAVGLALSILPQSRAEVVVVDDHLLEHGDPSLCRRLRTAGCHLPCIVHAGLPPAHDMVAGWAADAVVLKSLVGDELEAEIRRLVGAVDARSAESGPPASSAR